jgi:hypothetical protein
MKLRLAVLIANRNADGTPMRDEAGAISRRMFDVVVAQSAHQGEHLCRAFGIATPVPGHDPSTEITLSPDRLRSLDVTVPGGRLTIDGTPTPGYDGEPTLAVNVREAVRRAQGPDAIASLVMTGETSAALSYRLQDA